MIRVPIQNGKNVLNGPAKLLSGDINVLMGVEKEEVLCAFTVMQQTATPRYFFILQLQSLAQKLKFYYFSHNSIVKAVPRACMYANVLFLVS